MSKQVREAIELCVRLAIEGGELVDAVAALARVAGVPFVAVECVECGGWADAGDSPAHINRCHACGDVY